MRVILTVVAALFLTAVVAAGIVFFQYQGLVNWAQTPHAVQDEAVVEIAAGSGPNAIARRLEAQGAIDDAAKLYRYLRYVRRVGGQLRAGDYLFNPDSPQTPDQIVDRLLKGEILSVKVTLPEGLRIDEQAALFEQAGFGAAEEFIKKARDPAFVKALGFEANSLEGYLFPDTYLIPKNATVEQILRWQVERFHDAWNTALKQKKDGISLSRHDAVTLSSIIEKETGQPDERPRISCVFHNRLRLDMKLQTDPTVIYSIILRKGAFDGKIRRSDLDASHPYNTYSVKGLPPGPIASAGLAALEATLNPIVCDDLFFVSRNDGTHVFCPNLRCHNAAVEKWQREYFRLKRAAAAKK